MKRADSGTSQKTVADVEAAGLRRFMARVNAAPMLSFKTELMLVERARSGDRHANHRLIEAHLRLVVSIAKEYQRSGLPLLDLIQEGAVGLAKAADRFDPAAGARLGTFARWSIHGEISRAIERQVRMIRLPRRVLITLARISRMQNMLLGELRREPTIEEIAYALSWPTPITAAEVEEIVLAAQHPIALSSPVATALDLRVEECIEDVASASPFELCAEQERATSLMHGLQSLTPRQREVLELRYGLRGGGEQTLQAVGEQLGLTRERIRQIEGEALGVLRALVPDEELSARN